MANYPRYFVSNVLCSVLVFLLLVYLYFRPIFFMESSTIRGLVLIGGGVIPLHYAFVIYKACRVKLSR